MVHGIDNHDVDEVAGGARGIRQSLHSKSRAREGEARGEYGDPMQLHRGKGASRHVRPVVQVEKGGSHTILRFGSNPLEALEVPRDRLVRDSSAVCDVVDSRGPVGAAGICRHFQIAFRARSGRGEEGEIARPAHFR